MKEIRIASDPRTRDLDPLARYADVIESPRGRAEAECRMIEQAKREQGLIEQARQQRPLAELYSRGESLTAHERAMGRMHMLDLYHRGELPWQRAERAVQMQSTIEAERRASVFGRAAGLAALDLRNEFLKQAIERERIALLCR